MSSKLLAFFSQGIYSFKTLNRQVFEIFKKIIEIFYIIDELIFISGVSIQNSSKNSLGMLFSGNLVLSNVTTDCNKFSYK